MDKLLLFTEALVPFVLQKCDRGGERRQICTHADQLSVGGEEITLAAAAERQDGPGGETNTSSQLWEVLEVRQTQDTSGTGIE